MKFSTDSDEILKQLDKLDYGTRKDVVEGLLNDGVIPDEIGFYLTSDDFFKDLKHMNQQTGVGSEIFNESMKTLVDSYHRLSQSDIDTINSIANKY